MLLLLIVWYITYASSMILNKSLYHLYIIMDVIIICIISANHISFVEWHFCRQNISSKDTYFLLIFLRLNVLFGFPGKSIKQWHVGYGNTGDKDQSYAHCTLILKLSVHEILFDQLHNYHISLGIDFWRVFCH